MTVLTTARLALREMRDGDLDDLAALLSDTTVVRYHPQPRTRTETLEWIRVNQAHYRAVGHAPARRRGLRRRLRADH